MSVDVKYCEWCLEPVDCSCNSELKRAYESLWKTMQVIAHFEPDSDRRVVTLKRLATASLMKIGKDKISTDYFKKIHAEVNQ